MVFIDFPRNLERGAWLCPQEGVPANLPVNSQGVTHSGYNTLTQGVTHSGCNPRGPRHAPAPDIPPAASLLGKTVRCFFLRILLFPQNSPHFSTEDPDGLTSGQAETVLTKALRLILNGKLHQAHLSPAAVTYCVTLTCSDQTLGSSTDIMTEVTDATKAPGRTAHGLETGALLPKSPAEDAHGSQPGDHPGRGRISLA